MPCRHKVFASHQKQEWAIDKYHWMYYFTVLWKLEEIEKLGLQYGKLRTSESLVAFFFFNFLCPGAFVKTWQLFSGSVVMVSSGWGGAEIGQLYRPPEKVIASSSHSAGITLQNPESSHAQLEKSLTTC